MRIDMGQQLHLVIPCCVVVMFTVLGTGPARADDDARRNLVGGGSREWIYQRIVRSMGASDACTSGETYNFNADDTLTIILCQKGRIVSSRHKWSTADAGAGDTTITIDGNQVYYLLFKHLPEGGQLMRLRTKNQRQTEPVVDREFRLNED